MSHISQKTSYFVAGLLSGLVFSSILYTLNTDFQKDLVSSVFQIKAERVSTDDHASDEHIHESAPEIQKPTHADLSPLAMKHNEFLTEARGNPTSERAKSLARERRDVIRALVQKADYAALREYLLSETERNNLPKELRDLTEESVNSMEGVLHVMHIDYPDDSTEIGYDISTPTGPERIYVDTRNHPKKSELHANSVIFENNTRIQIKTGHRIDKDIITAYEEIVPLEVVAAEGDTVVGPAVSGVTYRKGLAVMINYTNDPVQPYTAESVSTNLFASNGTTSLNKYMIENSFGAMGFTGTVETAYVTVNITSTGACPYGTVSSEADKALQARGYNLANYQHRLYVAARSTYMNCGWSGLAYMPGSQSWYMGNSVGIYGHEITHNLGAHHAATLNCGSSSILSTGCSMSEYGDAASVMGSANTVHLNGAHKVQIGYMPSSRVILAKSSGDYTIAPIEINTTSPQVIKIPVNATRNYYIEYRQPLGLDAKLSSAYMQGVSVIEWTSGQTKRLDATPGDGNFANGVIVDGGRFVDTENNIQIEQLGHSASGATVRLSFSCTKNAPTITVTPDQVGSAGASATYTLSIKNNDTAFCPSSSYTLRGTVTSPLTGTFSSPSVSVAPGATVNAPYVISTSGAPTGSYPLSLTVVDASSTTINTTNRTHTIVENTPPVISSCTYCTSTTTTTVSGRSVTLSASATDGGGAPGVSIYVNGVLKASGTSSVTTKLQISKDPAGKTYTVDYIAKDSMGAEAKKTVTMKK